ncbi:MAG: leucine-rich repeat domain-containing protein [Eubacteriales bacterium]
MNRRAAVFAAVLLMTAALYGCVHDDGITEDTTTFTDETAPYYTEDFSYMLHVAAGVSNIEITGIQKEHQTGYTVPAEIDGVPVTAIGENAFIYAPVVQLILPNTLEVIKNGAFYNCAALTSVKIPENVAVIEDYAFYCCTMLKEVSVPLNCADIGGLAFFGTPWFESLNAEFESFGDGILIDYNGAGGNVIIPSGIKNLSSAFYQNTQVTSVILPSTAVKIGNAAFNGCTSLTSAEMTESVTYIGDSAFYGCTALKSLTIPAAVTYIGVNAFNGCDSLILSCYPGSYAAEYAESNGLGYQIIK